MLTLKNSPVRSPGARLTMLPCARILDHSSAYAAGADPTPSPVLQPASETPRYCAGASLQEKALCKIDENIKRREPKAMY